MANTIIAGNGTNNGLAVTSDATGALNILTGSGGGTAAISIDSSQNVTMAANLSVTGNTTVTGTLSATNGITGSLKSGTAVASTSGTSIDFTSLPTGLKRITIMFNGVSTSGTAALRVQLGVGGSAETSGYLGSGSTFVTAAATVNFTSGFDFWNSTVNATEVMHGMLTITLVNSNIWVAFGGIGASNEARMFQLAGSKTLAGTLNMIRVTTSNGTDTFDAGSINILFE